jgi:hypothetical protein
MSKHIQLYGTSYGFCVTSSTLNYNAGNHDFYNGSTRLLSLSSGPTINLYGGSTPQLAFNPSSGSTKVGQLYQSGDNLILGISGTGGIITMDLANRATRHDGAVTVYAGAGPDLLLTAGNDAASAVRSQIQMGYNNSTTYNSWISSRHSGSQSTSAQNAIDFLLTDGSSGGTLSTSKWGGSFTQRGLLVPYGTAAIPSISFGTMSTASPQTGLRSNAGNSVEFSIAGTVVGWFDNTGLSMYGSVDVTLTRDPTAALHAATKQYVDAHAGGGNYVSKSGDTMSGHLSMEYNLGTANPGWNQMQITTRGYTGNQPGGIGAQANDVSNSTGCWCYYNGYWYSTVGTGFANGYRGIYASAFTTGSDSVLKEQIRDVETGEVTKAFAGLNPKRFLLKNREKDMPSDGLKWGFLADQLALVPELDQVAIPDRLTETPRFGWDVPQVIAILCAKMKLMEAEINALKGK